MSSRVAIAREVTARIVKMLSEKNVKITQRGSKAFVEYNAKGRPTRVNIPYTPDDASDELLDAVQGFIDHEVAHILFTDYAALAKANKLGVKKLHNIIEDSFIEMKMARHFAGSGLNLRNVGSFYLREHTDKQLLENPDAADAILFVAAVRAWGGHLLYKDYMSDKWHHLKQITDALGDAVNDVAKCATSIDCVDLAVKFKSLLSKPKEETKSGDEGKEKGEGKGESKKSSTEGESDKKKPEAAPEESKKEEDAPKDVTPEDSEDSAPSEEKSEDIEKPETSEKEREKGDSEEASEDEDIESDPAPEESDKPEEKEPEESETSEESESKNSGDFLSDDEDEDSADDGSDSSPGSDEGDDSSASGGGDGIGKPEDELPDEDPTGEGEDVSGEKASGGSLSPSIMDDLEEKISESDFDDSIAAAITKLAADDISKSSYAVYSRDFDVVEPLHVPEHFSDESLVAMQKAVDHLVAPLQKDLERAVAARSAATWSAGHRSGRLNSSSLSRLATFKDGRVFRRKEIAVTKNVAITLLVDCSGSMSGSKMETAAFAAYGLSSVLDRMNIANEVLGFTTAGQMKIEGEDRHIEYSRIESLYIPILKTFSERLTLEHKRRFAYLPQSRLRNNVDGESVEVAAIGLSKRTEARKILMVLSDGQPCAYGDIYQLSQHLKRVVTDITRSGIDVLGIGIKDSSVKEFYPKSVVINNVGELPSVVIGQIKQLLMK